MRITHDKIRISQLKALIKKYVLRALLKDMSLNVSDLRRKTVPQFGSSRLKGSVTKCR